MADAVSREGGVLVAGIFPPGNVAFPEEALDGLAVHIEQRTHHAFPGDGKDSREPGGPAAAQEPEQNCLRLVRARVAERDAIHQAGLQPLAKELPPDPPGQLFEVLAALRLAEDRRRFSGRLLRGPTGRPFLGRSEHRRAIPAPSGSGPDAAPGGAEPSGAPVRAGRAAGRRNPRHRTPPRQRCRRARTCYNERWFRRLVRAQLTRFLIVSLDSDALPIPAALSKETVTACGTTLESPGSA